MDIQNISRNYVIVSVKPTYLDKQIVSDLAVPLLAFSINLSLILLTLLKEPFKSAVGVRNVVLLQCFGGLFYTSFKLVTFISAFIWTKYKIKFSILVSTFYVQFNMFLYNFNYSVPSIITYWRFILIMFHRETSIYENIAVGIFTLLFNFVSLIHTTFFATNMYPNSMFTAFYTYGSILEEIFPWFDMAPQIISGSIAFILNIILLVKIRIEKKKTALNKKNASGEISLTVNLLFHTIMPLILILYANIYYSLLFFAGMESVVAEMVYDYMELFYLVICPVSLVLFIELYRRFFFSLYYDKKMNNKVSVKISYTKTIA
uniref:Serpentine receptor class gamma n=1 Tax=Parastrongyloides trichosuri TaxID=131310 RepID=A0A0N5A632_PARTI